MARGRRRNTKKGNSTLLGVPHIRCLCKKIYAESENAAKMLHKDVVDRYGDNNQVRYYECSFGGWHWTSQIDKKAVQHDNH